MFVKLYYYVAGSTDKITLTRYVIPVSHITLISTRFTTIAENVCVTEKDYNEGKFKSDELFYNIRITDETRQWVECDLYLSNRRYSLYIIKEDYDKIIQAQGTRLIDKVYKGGIRGWTE